MHDLMSMNKAKHLSDVLFLLPNADSVHERMELEWLKRNGIRPAAICSRGGCQESLHEYFSEVHHLDSHLPSGIQFLFIFLRLLILNFSSLLAMPVSHWKKAIGYFKHEVSLGIAVHNCLQAEQQIRHVYSFWAFHPIPCQVVKLLNPSIRTTTRIHGGDLYKHSDYIGQMHIWPWRQKALKSYDSILSVSKEGAEYLKRTHALNNVFTVYLGSRCPPETRQDCTQIDRSLFVSVANIIPSKRLDMIAEIIRSLECPITWHHFGSARTADYDDELKTRIDGLLAGTEHSVIWHGQKTTADIFNFYLKSSPGLFISTSETEGIPVSVMEAMSCGIPILTTDAGGSHELVTNNGLCLSIDFDIAEAREWIMKNLENTENVTFMAEQSMHLWAERFHFDKNQETWMKWFESR